MSSSFAASKPARGASPAPARGKAPVPGKGKSGGPPPKRVKRSDDDLDGNVAVATTLAPSDSEDEAAAVVAAPAVGGAGTASSAAPKGGATSGVKRKRDAMSGGAGGAATKVTGILTDAPVGKGKKGNRGKAVFVSRLPLDAQVEAFWGAFTKSKVGARLADDEISHPLKVDHLVSTVLPAAEAGAAPGAAAAGGATAAAAAPAAAPADGTAPAPSGEPSATDVSDIVSAVQAALGTGEAGWKKTFGWKSGASKRPAGAPAVLILTYSGPRAAAMLKPLSFFKTRVAKCFAKHMSVEDQKEILAGPPVTIAIGTPHRVAKLLEAGALSLAHCSTILVDARPDMTTRTMLEHPNLAPDFWGLYREHLHARVTGIAAAQAAAAVAAAGAAGAASGGGKGGKAAATVSQPKLALY